MIWLKRDVQYIPDVLIKIAERNGLKNIPATAAQYAFPILSLCPVGKNREAVLKRVRDIQGDRWPYVGLELAKRTDPNPGKPNEDVHIFLKTLQNPANDFEEWRTFVKNTEGVIPTLQLNLQGGQTNYGLDQQISDFLDLGRGMIFRCRRKTAASQAYQYESLLHAVKTLERQDALDQLLVIADVGMIENNENIEFIQHWLEKFVSELSKQLSGRIISIALSGTSFPQQFKGQEGDLSTVKIKERELYDLCHENVSQNVEKFIYGDYASTRGEKEPAGGGLSPARIDFPECDKWIYNRQRYEDRKQERIRTERNVGFHLAAKRLVDDGDLGSEIKKLEGLYGANEILSAADDSEKAKGSQSVWTGVRVNLHVFQQATYGLGDLPGLEDEFVD